MARYRIDVDGVSHARAALLRDPLVLHECAVGLGVAAARAGSACPEAPELRNALERFGYVHGHAVEALSAAAEALGGRVDIVTIEARGVEHDLAAAFTTVASELT